MITKTKLYNGKVILSFDDSKHLYSVSEEGKEEQTAFGITSILSVINKPALVQWAANMGKEVFLANVEAGKALDELKLKEVADLIGSAHRQKKNKAADIGTLIHDWLEKAVKAKIEGDPVPKPPVNKEMLNAVKGFVEWVKENKVRFLASERKVYSRQYGYAGTVDCVALVNGKKTILDFKTGKSIYPEYFLQTTAYQQAIQEEDGDFYDQVYILRLSQEDKEKGTSAFEVKKSEDFETNLKAFLAAHELYKWQTNVKKQEIIKKFSNPLKVAADNEKVEVK